MFRIICGVWIIFSFSISAFSQNFLGYQGSNYNGVNGIDIQPASIADSRLRFDVLLGGASGTIQNNYIGLLSSAFLNGSVWDINGDNYKDLLTQNLNGGSKSFYVNYDIHLPSFMISLSPKHSIGITARWRTFFNMDKLEEPGARLAYSLLDEPDLWNTQLNNDGFSMDVMSYMEFGVAYGRVLYDSGPHMVKGGARVKLLSGLAAMSMYANRFEYSFESPTIVNVHESDVEYAHSLAIDDINGGFDPLRDLGSLNSQNLGLGLDLGFVYEFRPEHDRYQSGVGESAKPRRDLNKYKYRIGLSVLDIGSINFDRSTQSRNFTGSVSGYDLTQLSINGFTGFDSTLLSEFDIAEGDNSFSMALPTAVSLQADFKLGKKFYLNVSPFIAFKRNNKPNHVHTVTNLSVTPRWEGKWWGVAVPFSNTDNSGFAMGALVRLGPLVVGSANIASAFITDNMKSIDIHVGFKAPIPYGKPKDKDKDGIPDKEDKCPEEPGIASLEGCPEKVDSPEIATVDEPEKEEKEKEIAMAEEPKVEKEKKPKKEKKKESKTSTKETPEEKNPATETPATETPATETPATETPAVETPKEETPDVASPTQEPPASETKPPVSVTPKEDLEKPKKEKTEAIPGKTKQPGIGISNQAANPQLTAAEKRAAAEKKREDARKQREAIEKRRAEMLKKAEEKQKAEDSLKKQKAEAAAKSRREEQEALEKRLEELEATEAEERAKAREAREKRNAELRAQGIDPSTVPPERNTTSFAPNPMLLDDDGDGIINRDDKCRYLPGPKDNMGCPIVQGEYDKGKTSIYLPFADTDSDGVINQYDKCPETPGLVERDGCPASDPRGLPQSAIVPQNFELDAFERIYFESGKDYLRGQARIALNNVANYLRDNPEIKLKIMGHADNIGTNPFNDGLSIRRCSAVQNYLINKGLPEERLIIEFYGERLPTAENTTEDGRQKNRRVELVLFAD